jgi:hypothetical protein
MASVWQYPHWYSTAGIAGILAPRLRIIVAATLGAL